MKVYCFGEKEKPVIFLFPGTCCHWKGNFGKVIEPLEEYFRVACVSYDGFDETEQTEFPTMTEETEKIEQYIKKEIWRTYLCRIWLFTGRFFCRTACSTRKYPHGVWYFRWFRFRPVGKVFGKADDETDDAGFLSVYREW